MPERTALWWVALISTPTANGRSTVCPCITAPTDPSVSASTHDAPPCSSPYGWVLPSTGIVPTTRSGDASLISTPIRSPSEPPPPPPVPKSSCSAVSMSANVTGASAGDQRLPSQRGRTGPGTNPGFAGLSRALISPHRGVPGSRGDGPGPSLYETERPKRRDAPMTEPQETVETRGDDRVDLIATDANGDGKPDVWVADTDGDGKADLFQFDTDGDGKVDVTMVDLDQDGQPDTVVDGDGGIAPEV